MHSYEKAIQLVRRFLDVASEPVAYNPERKALFHRRGKTLLARIARDLGYREDQYDLRNNQRGIAVSGEITLHADNLYIQLSQRCFSGGEFDILYRDCQDRRDYTSGHYHFMRFDALLDYENALQRFTAAKRNPVTIIDIGETVLCDLCNGDYTKSDAEGGLLIGSHAVCPECAPDIRKSADEHGEPVTACPPGMRFRDWVLTLRDGRNTIEITAC
jgi:hypothetical protein